MTGLHVELYEMERFTIRKGEEGRLASLGTRPTTPTTTTSSTTSSPPSISQGVSCDVSGPGEAVSGIPSDSEDSEPRLGGDGGWG